jgi:hypothetical protein
MHTPRTGSNKSPLRHELQTRLVSITRLKPFSRQIRQHPAAQIRKLAKSVDSFGFVIVVVDRTELEYWYGVTWNATTYAAAGRQRPIPRVVDPTPLPRRADGKWQPNPDLS